MFILISNKSNFLVLFLNKLPKKLFDYLNNCKEQTAKSKINLQKNNSFAISLKKLFNSALIYMILLNISIKNK